MRNLSALTLRFVFASLITLLASKELVGFAGGVYQRRVAQVRGKVEIMTESGVRDVSYIRVTLNDTKTEESLYYSITSIDGLYYFDDVMPGGYLLFVWIEQSEPLKYRVSIEDIEDAEFVNLPRVLLPRPSADYRASFRTGVKAMDMGHWEEAADAMRRAINAEPDAHETERVRIYGVRYEEYRPATFLGEALAELGKCAEALRALELARTRGEISGQELTKRMTAKCGQQRKQ